MAIALADMSSKATHLPIRADPIRWPGEVDMRAPGGRSAFESVTSSPFLAVALHEHSGSFRNAWAQLGARAASVADRPSSTLPAAGSAHFISDVRAWHQSYPWTIPVATANPDCHVATVAVPYSAPERWLHYLRNGGMADAITHAVWLLHVAPRVALEQPPTLLEHIIGSPTVRTTLAAHGIPRRKEWLWWLVNLPPVHPSGPPAIEPPSEHRVHTHLDKERRSIARAETPPSFARAHAEAWLPLLAHPQRRTHSEFKALGTHTAFALARLTLVAAARLAPRMPAPCPETSVSVVPMARPGDTVLALQSKTGLFLSLIHI